MGGAPSAGDVGRLILEEQRIAFERFQEAAERYGSDLRRVLDGELDPLDFGRGMIGLTLTNTVRTAEGAARIAMSYARWIGGLAGFRGATEDTIA